MKQTRRLNPSRHNPQIFQHQPNPHIPQTLPGLLQHRESI